MKRSIQDYGQTSIIKAEATKYSHNFTKKILISIIILYVTIAIVLISQMLQIQSLFLHLVRNNITIHNSTIILTYMIITCSVIFIYYTTVQSLWVYAVIQLWSIQLVNSMSIRNYKSQYFVFFFSFFKWRTYNLGHHPFGCGTMYHCTIDNCSYHIVCLPDQTILEKNKRVSFWNSNLFRSYQHHSWWCTRWDKTNSEW